eukprot:11785593-Alexandrium_andersonii.AAC.1
MQRQPGLRLQGRPALLPRRTRRAAPRRRSPARRSTTHGRSRPPQSPRMPVARWGGPAAPSPRMPAVGS